MCRVLTLSTSHINLDLQVVQTGAASVPFYTRRERGQVTYTRSGCMALGLRAPTLT